MELLTLVKNYQIIPSLLSANVTKLGEEVELAMQAGADMVHLDIMDNHYVPNLTFGPLVCQALRERFVSLPIDVHIMATPVDNLITEFANAGANRISIHPNSTLHLDRSLQLIKHLKCQAGLAINPATSIDCLTWCVHRLDFVLIMTVNPGFGGQSLIPEVIKKIIQIRKAYPHLDLCVDGGVSIENIDELARAGITQFVAGSAIFHSENYADTINDMRKKLALI